MSKESEEEQFSPELVDEQVEQFLQDTATPSLESRLSHDLQASYTRDADSLAHVWQRLVLPSSSAVLEQQRTPASRGPVTWQKRSRLKRILPMQIIQEKAKRRSGIKRTLMLSAAVLAALIVVGGMLWVVGANQGTKAGQSPNTVNVKATNSTTQLQSTVYVGSSSGLVSANAQTGKVIWSYQIPTDSNRLGNMAFSRILVAGNIVYGLVSNIGDAPAQIIAFNAPDGTQLWSTNVPEATDIVLIQDKLYVSTNAADVQTNKSYISTLNASTGQGLTQVYTIDGYGPSLSQAGSTFYVSTDSNLAAFDTVRDRQIWQKSFADLGFHQASGSGVGFAVGGEGLYATYQDGNAVYALALKLSTGEKIWQTPPITVAGASGGGSGITAPVINDTTIYFAISGNAGAVFAYSAQQGKQLWSYSTGSMLVQRTPVFSGGNLYITEDIISTGSPKTMFAALNGITGKAMWSTSSQVGTGISAFVLNGIVYVATANDAKANTTYALRSANGTILWQAKLGTNPVALVAAS